MHISYEHDIDSFLTGTRAMLFDRTIRECGINQDGGAISVDTALERLQEAIFGFGQELNAHL